MALLPALLLRALTPVGFMPMHDAQGGLYLAFCPGIGDTLLPPLLSDDPHRHHHAMHDHDGQSAPRHHDVCPYALSAGPALAYSVPSVPGPATFVAEAPAPHYSSVSVPSIERAQSARAPPAPRIA
jgi:hypothetical protein